MAANEDMVGVSVGTTGKMLFLRFHLADQHLKKLKGPRATVRGQPKNGFMIEPDSKGLMLNRSSLKNGAYLQTTLTPFELSKTLRRRVDVRPTYGENNRIIIPSLPPAWIDAAGEFAVDADQHHGDSFKLHANPGNGISRLNGAGMNGSPTAPVAKAQLNYTVPDDATMAQMQALLASRLGDAREIIKQMEARTGMKFVLDRNLRLVVAM